MFTPIRRFMNKLTLAEIMREHVDQRCTSKASVTLLACGGKPPYVYSIDNFETQQSSPIFDNITVATSDTYDSDLPGWKDSLKHFWVKDSENTIIDYYSTIRYMTPVFIPQTQDEITLRCAAGETFVTITPGVTYTIPQLYPLDEKVITIYKTYTCSGMNGSIAFTDDEPFDLPLRDGNSVRYYLSWQVQKTEHCNRRNYHSHIYINVLPYMTLSEDADAHKDISCSACTQATTKGSITLTVDGGTAPFVYSKDNFATQQSSPTFNNLCLADADCYDSEDTGFIEGIQRFWVKDANDVVVYYDAVLKKPAPFTITSEPFDITVRCNAGETTYTVVPGTTFPDVTTYPSYDDVEYALTGSTTLSVGTHDIGMRVKHKSGCSRAQYANQAGNMITVLPAEE